MPQKTLTVIFEVDRNIELKKLADIAEQLGLGLFIGNDGTIRGRQLRPRIIEPGADQPDPNHKSTESQQ